MIYTGKIGIPSTSPLYWVDPSRNNEDEHYPDALSFVQKFGTTDTIHIQFLSIEDLTDTFYLKCYEYENDIPVLSVIFVKNTLSVGHYYWDATIYTQNINSALNGFNLPYIGSIKEVYFTIETTEILANSLPVYIGSFDDTLRILYHNSYNNLETVFGDFSAETAFSIRMSCGLRPDSLKPKSDHNVFYDQTHQPSLVYSLPYFEETLTFGNEGIPRWMLEKLNIIFSCDTVMLNNITYVRSGDIETNPDDEQMYHPSIPLVRATNRLTQNIMGNMVIVNEENTALTDENENVLTTQ